MLKITNLYFTVIQNHTAAVNQVTSRLSTSRSVDPGAVELAHAFQPYEVPSRSSTRASSASGPIRRRARTSRAPTQRIYHYTKSLIAMLPSLEMPLSTRDANITLRGQLTFTSVDTENVMKEKVIISKWTNNYFTSNIAMKLSWFANDLKKWKCL